MWDTLYTGKTLKCWWPIRDVRAHFEHNRPKKVKNITIRSQTFWSYHHHKVTNITLSPTITAAEPHSRTKQKNKDPISNSQIINISLPVHLIWEIKIGQSFTVESFEWASHNCWFEFETFADFTNVDLAIEFWAEFGFRKCGNSFFIAIRAKPTIYGIGKCITDKWQGN